MTQNPTQKPGLEGLTGLRAIAAFYVFVFHVNMRTPLDFLPNALQEIVRQGALGVNLFFVLSGFILTYSYYGKIERSQPVAFYKDFISRRIARIYPVYLAGLAACLLVSFALMDFPEPFGPIVFLNAFMIQSYIPDLSMLWYGGASWSISTEFFFYLLFPAVLPLLMKIRSSRTLFMLLAVTVLISATPGALYNFLDIGSYSAIYSFPLLRFPEFLCGMITGLLVFKFGWKIRPAACFLIAALGALYIVKFGFRAHSYVIHNIAFVPVVIVLLTAIVSAPRHFMFRWLASPLMVYAGKVSYSFYILQIPISIVLDHLLRQGVFSATSYSLGLVWFVINAALAVLAYQFIEHPANKGLSGMLTGYALAKTPPRKQGHQPA